MWEPECKKNPDLFDFDTPSAREIEPVLKRICQACPIKVACRANALSDRMSYGFQGGTTPQERPNNYWRNKTW